MAGEHVIHVKADNWQSEVLDSEIPVLVDFWAPWCGPCRIVSPILDELAGELAGKIKVAKVNVDENQEIAAKFNVRAIPTLLVLQKGAVKEQMVGALSKAALQSKLSAYM